MSVDVGSAIAYLDLDITGFIGGFSQAEGAIKGFTDSSSSFEKSRAVL